MRRSRYKQTYRIYADDDYGRDIRIFLSSLIIGLCVGAFAVYLFIARPALNLASLAPSKPQVVQQQSAECPKPALNRHDELESRLATCQADLARSHPVAAMPGVEPKDMPPLPKAPPRNLRAVEAPPAPAQQAAPTPAPEPVASPIEPTPPPPTASQEWPKDWPRKPAPTPPRPVGDVPQKVPEATPEPPLARPDAASVTLDVGQETRISGNYVLRLVAVSRRNTGKYCIVSGRNLAGMRLASGQAKNILWQGHSLSLTATVVDSDSCRVVLRPN